MTYSRPTIYNSISYTLEGDVNDQRWTGGRDYSRRSFWRRIRNTDKYGLSDAYILICSYPASSRYSWDIRWTSQT